MTAPADEKSTQAENELIAQWLLGWVRVGLANDGTQLWQTKELTYPVLPTFTTWHDAGLILEALRSTEPTLEYVDGKWDCYGGDPFESFYHAYADTGPLAVRAAALSYLRSLER